VRRCPGEPDYDEERPDDRNEHGKAPSSPSTIYFIGLWRGGYSPTPRRDARAGEWGKREYKIKILKKTIIII